MTFISLTQASRRLGIDAKTLRHWLAQAQLPLQAHPGDARLKGLSQEHLLLLARTHHRHLVELPQEPCSPPTPGEPCPLPAALLALPQTLSALEAQMAALQQQMAQLTSLLVQQAPSPASTTPEPPRARSSPFPRLLALVAPRLPLGPPIPRWRSYLWWSMAAMATTW